MIEISAQYGDPKAADKIWPLHRKLNELFEAYAGNKYFRTVEKLTIVLRVSGRVRDFGREGPERLKFLKRDKELTVDLVIPDERWRDTSNDEFRRYLTEAVQAALLRLVDVARQKGELIQPDVLTSDLRKVMSAFQDG